MEPIISEAQEQAASCILAEYKNFVCEAAKYLNTTNFSDADKSFCLLHFEWQALPQILAGQSAPPIDEKLIGRAVVALAAHATDIELSENALEEFNAKHPE